MNDTAVHSPDNLPRMGLMEHLEELRRRIIHTLAALMIAFFGCWAFREQIYDFLAVPIYRLLPAGEKLIFLGITDPFTIYVKVAVLAGVFLASPYVLFQLWRFVAPGLYQSERHAALPFIFFGSTLFAAGGAFGYYVAFPFAAEFLIEMGHQFDAQITVSHYLSFFMAVILGLALIFELPLVILFLARLGLVTPQFLLRHFRWAVLIIFILAAIITPTPDVLNLLVFAGPAILLYLVGVGLAFWVKPRKDAAEATGGMAQVDGE